MTQPGRARRFGGRARRGGLRQTTDWGRVVSVGSATIPAASKVFLAQCFLISGVPKATVRRTILWMRVFSDQQAATEDQLGAVGMHIANNNAVLVGAAAMLGPVTDQNDDAWFLWHPIVQRFRLVTASGFDGSDGHLYLIDSRAQRKLQEGESAVLLVENSSPIFGMSVTFGLSCLFGAGLER